MSFWQIMNYVAWGLSACLFFIMAKDFISVEKKEQSPDK
jgi:hypothetical protein